MIDKQTVDDLIEYLNHFRGRRVFPTESTVSGVADGEEYLVLSNILAFWYPEGDISKVGQLEFGARSAAALEAPPQGD